jgi:hypothetical protein
MVGRACAYQMPTGRPCRANPLRDEKFCFWHAPETAEEAADARRLGGKRTVAAIYGLNGLRTIADLQAVLETVTIETLTLENSVARNRTVGSFLTIAAKLLEVGELEDRLAALEAAVKHRPDPTDAVGLP